MKLQKIFLLFHNILIFWAAPVYICLGRGMVQHQFFEWRGELSDKDCTPAANSANESVCVSAKRIKRGDTSVERERACEQ